MLELAAAKGCDALITGDIKHDRWYAAEFAGIALFDCGHYGTERFAAGILAEQIRKALPAAQVTENAGRNPAEFCRGVKKHECLEVSGMRFVYAAPREIVELCTGT